MSRWSFVGRAYGTVCHKRHSYPFSVDVQVELLFDELGDGCRVVTGGIQDMIGRLAIEGRAFFQQLLDLVLERPISERGA